SLLQHLKLHRISRYDTAWAQLNPVLEFVALLCQGLFVRGAGYFHIAERRTPMARQPRAVRQLGEGTGRNKRCGSAHPSVLSVPKRPFHGIRKSTYVPENPSNFRNSRSKKFARKQYSASTDSNGGQSLRCASVAVQM